jgi:hypothetical protein
MKKGFVVVMAAIALLPVLMAMLVISGAGADGKNPCTYPIVIGKLPYSVYSDIGIPPRTGVWHWDGGSGSFEGEYTDEAPPEGKKCFKTYSENWAGWGVFLSKPSEHTVNLSDYNSLKFWVKTPEDLKVEIQEDNHGKKHTKYLSRLGWDGINTWQEITIPTTAFTSADMSKIFSPFMVTIEASGTFYIDNVTWEPVSHYRGNDSSNPEAPYNTYSEDSRAQVLYRASDMVYAGMSTGTITAIQLRCYQAPGRPNLKNFSIQMQNTSATNLTTWITTGWTLVYGPMDVVPTAGEWYTFKLSTPFVWDGTSNLLIDFSRDDTASASGGGMHVVPCELNQTYAGFNNSAYTWPFDDMPGAPYNFRPSLKITCIPA